MKHFFKNLLKHPGTWTFLALLSIGIGIAVPPAAPVLVAVAAGCISAAAPATYFFSKRRMENREKDKAEEIHIVDKIKSFITNHPIQAAIVFFGIALVITALVLTIGFFTGGAVFAFMAPVFAALAAPFAATGLSLNLAALAGATLIFASITLPNMLKRFAGWLDSFTRDAAAVRDNKEDMPSTDWKTQRSIVANRFIGGTLSGYLSLWAEGVRETIKHGFSSPDAERLEQEAKPPVQNI